MKEIFRGCGAKKIHQGNEIYAVCKKMRATFTANDIKEILMQSDSEKMRNLSAGHISAQLCKLAQDHKILLVRKGGGRGRPNEYKLSICELVVYCGNLKTKISDKKNKIKCSVSNADFLYPSYFDDKNKVNFKAELKIKIDNLNGHCQASINALARDVLMQIEYRLKNNHEINREIELNELLKTTNKKKSVKKKSKGE